MAYEIKEFNSDLVFDYVNSKNTLKKCVMLAIFLDYYGRVCLQIAHPRANCKTKLKPNQLIEPHR